MGRERDYDLSHLKEGLKSDIVDAITEAFNEGTDEGINRGEKVLKDRVKKKKMSVTDNRQFDTSGTLTSEQKSQIEKAVGQQFEQVQTIIEQAMSKHKNKWKNFDLFKDVFNGVDFDISSLEKKLEKLYSKDTFGSPKDNKKFTALYSAHQALGGKKIDDYEHELRYLTQGSGVESVSAGERHELEFFQSLFDTVQKLVPVLKAANSEVKEMKQNSSTSAVRKPDKNHVISGDQSSVLSGGNAQLVTDEEREIEAQERKLQLQKEHIRLVKEAQELQALYVKSEEEQGYDFRSQETSQANVKLLEKLIELRQNENSLKEAGIEFDSRVRELAGLKENELDEELRLAQAVLEDWIDVNKQIESVKDNQKDLAYYMGEVVRLRDVVRTENWFDDDDREDTISNLQLAEKQLKENIEYYQKYDSVASDVASKVNQTEVLSNQTPLSPSTTAPEKTADAVEEAAQEIVEADEKAETANEELAESEGEVAQETVTSRERASNAAREHADEVVKASKKIVQALEEERKVYSEADLAGRDIVSQSGLKETHVEVKDNEEHTVGSFSFIERLQDGQLQNVLVQYDELTDEWYETVMGLSTAFEKVGNEIISLDNKINQYTADMEKQKAAHPTYDTSGDEKLIALAEERRGILLSTLQAYNDEEEYAYELSVFEEKRIENQKRLDALKDKNSNLLQAKADEKATKAAEQYTQAIAQANRYLNTQEKKLEHIEKTYNKALNPDLEKSVTNQNDLAELESKKNEIQTLVNKLKNTPRDTSNEQDYLNLEKMIAAYKDLADYKKKANNPTKGELGGQNLETLVSVQVNDYKKLIEKAKTFGDQTEANVQLLEAQLAILEKVDSNGKHTATADDYYNARDLYKVERSNISLVESQNKGTKTVSEIDKVSEALKHLIATEDTYQKLVIKRDLKSLSPDDAKQLAELTVARQRDNIVLEQNISLTKEQQALQDKYTTKKSDVQGGMKAYQDALIEGQLKSYTKFYDSIEANKRNLTPVVEYKQKIDELQISIAKLQSLQEAGIDITDSKELADVKELVGHIETLQYDLRNMKNNVSFQELDTEEANKKLVEISKTLEKNTRMSKELRAEFKALSQKYEVAIKTGASQKELEDLNAELAKLQANLYASGKTGNSFFNLVGKKIHGMAAQFFAMYLSFQDLLQIMRRGFEVIKEYDSALTEMNKVSDESISTLKAFQQESFALADAIGATASAVQNSTADWMRLGESLEDAKKSAEATNILFNVSEFESIDAATDSLVSMSQAYKDLEKMDIVDIMNNIGNNYSISTDGLATALQKSASALTTANNDINEAVALITAGNAVAQDPDSVGAGLRTISLRLVGTEAAKKELEALGEEADDVITTTSKLRDVIISATQAASEDGKGFDILDDNGNYKSTYEIMLGLSELYDDIVKKDKELGTNNLNLLLETIAGKNRSNIAASILQNSELLESVYNSSLDSEGSALKENEAYLESIEGHLNQLKNAWDSLWVNENNREVITFFLDLAKGILEAVDGIGVFNTALLGIGGFLGAKSALSGGGRAKCCPSREYATGEFSSDVYELCVA